MSNEAKNVEFHTKCTCAALKEMIGLYFACAPSAAEAHQLTASIFHQEYFAASLHVCIWVSFSFIYIAPNHYSSHLEPL